MQQSENIRGAIYMCLSMIGFVFNDAVIKYASTDIGMYQSIFIRGCFAVIIIGAACIHSGVFKKIPNKSDHKLIFWRTVAEIFATITLPDPSLNLIFKDQNSLGLNNSISCSRSVINFKATD